VKEHSDACFRVAEQLTDKYYMACLELRSHGFSGSAEKRLAKLLLEWSIRNGESIKAEPRIILGLSLEEIGQMIRASRETVSRLFATMKKRQVVQAKGPTLAIHDKAALKALATE
jgi:CRP-like cAMP-binding protein